MNPASFFITLVATFFGCLIGVPILFAFFRMFGLYTVVPERRCHVYVLFGKVLDTLNEPGLYSPLKRMGWRGLIVNILGRCYVVDMRLDQEYLRSQAVNSEEGAPMGIGVWYEMFISDPVAFLFRNTDPRGSLRANVSNSTVRCLSNMPLDEMLIDRHKMSHTVRLEVSPKSNDWGYQLGSVYIRKVHFRDHTMIKEIESKVVNRLRQVTSAIKQAGSNRVSIISGNAEKKAAVEFAKAGAIRPKIVGEALHNISHDAAVADALFDVLEIQKIIEGGADVILLPENSGTLSQWLAANDDAKAPGKPPGLPGHG